MVEEYVVWFEYLRKEDVPKVGGKAANLGELINAGIPVPPGFAITAQAYKSFLERTGLDVKIREALSKSIKDPTDPKQTEEASRVIRSLIEGSEIPHSIKEAIVKAYRELGRRLNLENPLVAVRSSATAEDLPDASFAGQQETFLNVSGEEELLSKVIKCWSSLYTPRAIFYRSQKGFSHEKVFISVAVQKMVNSKAAGVMFTIHPVTGDPNKIVIEGSWGLGEAVVGGSVTPDRFVVDKQTLKILEKHVVEKPAELIRNLSTGKTEWSEVPPERKKAPCLTDEEIVELAKTAKKIEDHYGRPQDIEWAIDCDLPFPSNIFIVQSRAETVWSAKKAKLEKAPGLGAMAKLKAVVKGLPASPGIAVGKAKIGMSPEEVAKIFSKGDVLVTRMTNPDWAAYMKMASAIITDEGGMTCHAAIVSRELGIPCIVGTGNATKVLRTGQLYTVDANAGVVYEGEGIDKEPSVAPTFFTSKLAPEYVPITATKVYMNLGVPEKIEEYKDLPFDGIGLMRIEFIIADWIEEHPLYLIEVGKAEKFVNKLAEGISMVARAIRPKPVVVRFSDFKTNEYRMLKGGEKYEQVENNPMLGYRGVSRYISPQYREAFKLECKAIRKVRDEYGLRNVWVMLPFVRTTWEVEKCLEIMEEEGLTRTRDFNIWIMAEVPSVIFLADEFCKYVDGFSIGSNDLTQLILGTDRDSQVLPSLDPRYFDERDPAVKRAIEHLIKVAHEHGVTVSICGQGPSVYPEFTEFLVRCGIDSISVNPDVVIQTKRLVASVEQKILLEGVISKRVQGLKEIFTSK
ncbi:MAG: phosphoenolpyruvate synthase [Candidatus Nezhaarchaeales archaeon]